VLGAGLDTFSLRNPFADQGVRVFEVDHPATQAWKRERLEHAGVALPASLTFAPVDFERQSLAEGLANAGFDRGHPAFFQWLGVVPYLTREAISSTLDTIASVPASAVAFDYTEPFENHSPERRASLMATAESAAERGEPWALPNWSAVSRSPWPKDFDMDRAGMSSAPRASAHFPKFVHHFSNYLLRTSESYGHQQTYDSSAAFRFEVPGFISPLAVQGLQIGGTRPGTACSGSANP
jgi:hypothetical protein